MILIVIPDFYADVHHLEIVVVQFCALTTAYVNACPERIEELITFSDIVIHVMDYEFVSSESRKVISPRDYLQASARLLIDNRRGRQFVAEKIIVLDVRWSVDSVEVNERIGRMSRREVEVPKAYVECKVCRAAVLNQKRVSRARINQARAAVVGNEEWGTLGRFWTDARD
jgi:hypothetical protein